MMSTFNKSRRKLLANAGITAVASQLPTSYLSANIKDSKFELDNLNQQIIKHVKGITKNRNVTLSILQPKGSLGNIKPTGDLFYKHTGVGINYIEASLDEINAKIMAQSLANNTYFDIALPATFGVPDLVEAGVIQDLTALADQYQPDDYTTGMLYPIGDYYKGKFYGYQTDGDTYLMFYNKSWLEDKQEKKKFLNKYGYPLSIPSTWVQLDQMIEFFHRPDENKFGGALFRNKDYLAWEWWTRFHAKGRFPFDNKLNPQINSNAGIDALSSLIKTTQYLYPDSRSNGLFENWEAFFSGKYILQYRLGWYSKISQ